MKKFLVTLTLSLFAIYYLSPLLATFFYASSTSWEKVFYLMILPCNGLFNY